ncbi:MAG TPA: hypothetical protein VKD69_23920, partial [Vicinamibacterales bacterium]|nr:hypothetical protein [Vicinamibacterales bacterium]
MKSALSCALIVCGFAAAPAGQPSGQAARVDAVFAKWAARDTPGCAVGASTNGKPVVAKGYGMA